VADYYGCCRSNYVRVKPDQLDLFKERAERAGFTVRRMGKHHMIMNDECGLPSAYVHSEDDGDEIDWGKDFGLLLAEGEVLHLVEIGQEKMRYLTGIAVWIMSDGKTEWSNVHNPPKRVKQFAAKHKTAITENAY
jgi:hypothetical protein